MRRLSLLPAAVLLVVGGALHLDLWRDGYRFVDDIGVLFLANFALSVLLAGAVVAVPRRPVLLGAAAFAVGSFGALLASRTVGLLGFLEPVWTDAAWQVATAELGAVVALAVVAAASRRRAPAVAALSRA